jgi:hypothetical protein
MRQLFESKKYNNLFWILLAAYAIFGLLMVWRSSFIAIDGKRYFVLYDDAMISMRYANNLLQGNGLVWNPGEHIEGFTTPLMVFIYTAAIGLFGKIYASLVIQLLGLALAVLSVYLSVRVFQMLIEPHSSRFEEQSKPSEAGKNHDALAFLVSVLTMAFYPILYWSIMGMESGWLVAVVLLIFYLDFREQQIKKFNLPLVLVLSTVYILRAEGVLFLAGYFILRLARKIKYFKAPGIFYSDAEVFVVFLPAIAYQVFRLIYYKLWWPNTYLLKVEGWDKVLQLKNGFLFDTMVLQRFALFIVPVVVFFFVWAFSSEKSLKAKLHDLLFGRLSYVALFAFLFFVYNAFQIWVGGDAWPPYWRIMTPYVPTFFIAAIFGFKWLAERWAIRRDDFLAFLWLVAFSLFMVMPIDYNNDFLLLKPWQSINNRDNVNISLAIEDLSKPSASIVTFWAGTAPYFSERYAHDPMGKTDAYIASLPVDFAYNSRGKNGMFTTPGHNKYDLRYSFEKLQPDIIWYMRFNGEHYCSLGSQNLEEWCSQHYVIADHMGKRFLLKKNSPNIYWDKVSLVTQ